MGNYYSDLGGAGSMTYDNVQNRQPPASSPPEYAPSRMAQGQIGGPAYQRPQAAGLPPVDFNRPWYAGTDSRDERSGLEMEQARRQQSNMAGISQNDPVQRLLRFGTVGSDAGPQGTPSIKDMPKALADQSRGRFGLQDSVQNLDLGGGNFMTGRDGGLPDSSGGGFVSGNTAYNVNGTSQQGVQRVTARGASPLYTNIRPEDAVSGLNNQMIGGSAADVQQGLDRYQRANDIRGQMLAGTQDKNMPANGYGPGILGGDGPSWQERQNAEATARWAQDDQNQRMRTLMSGGTSADRRAALAAMAQLSGQQTTANTQMRGQDSAERIAGARDQAQFGVEGMRGSNQLAAERMRGRNQLTMVDQQGQNYLDLEDRRERAPSALAQAGWYNAQTNRANDEMSYGKTQSGILQKNMEMLIKGGMDPDIAFQRAAKMAIGAHRAAQMPKGSPEGYADGGGVAPMSRAQQMLADMDAKYGKTAAPAPVATPQPVPAPPPPAPQQPQGLSDKFRGYFGATDARMKQNGLAFGGAVPGGQAVAQAVAGRQVFGQSDGSGEDDALPAVIDGKRPAALTSGEFVWPVNAVKFYGMDRLNKMLAAAEKGMASQGDTA